MARTTILIFDMYNTLVQNEPHHWGVTFDTIIKHQQLDTTVEAFREHWRPEEMKFQVSRIQPGAPFQSYFEGWRDAFSRVFATLGLQGDASAASRQSITDLGTRPPYPETVAALWEIQKRWRTALLSNADDDYLDPALANLGVKFEAVLSSEQARCYKPDPGLYREMLRRLDVSPEEAVYVGDRQLEDVKGAGQAGMRTMWINRFGAMLDPNLPAPDMEISSLLEIPRVIGE